MQFSTLLGVAAFLVLANAIPTPTDDSYDALASLANSNPDELSNDPGLSQDLGDAEIYYDGNNPNKQRDMQPDIRPRYSCDDCWNCDALQDCIHYDDDGDDDECDKSASCYRFCLSCSDNDKRGVTKFQATPYHILPRNDSSNSDVNHVDVTFIGASGTNNFSIPATVDGNPTNVYGAQVPFSNLSWSQIQNNTSPSDYDFFEKCTLQSWNLNGTAQLADVQGCEACNNLWNIGQPQTIKSITCQP